MFVGNTQHKINDSSTSQLDAIGKGDPTKRFILTPYLCACQNSHLHGTQGQQNWLVLVPKNERVSAKGTRLKEYEFGVGGTSILCLGLSAFRKWGIFSRFSKQFWPFYAPSPPMKAAPLATGVSLYNHFSLLFSVKINTIKNILHSHFFTSMKRKHRETLPRNEVPDLFKGKNPFLRLPQDSEGGIAF